MRNASYQNTFEKISRRTLVILEKMRYKIISSNSEIIHAQRDGGLFSQTISLEIIIRNIDENCTQISVKATTKENLIFTTTKNKDTKAEDEFIEMLTSYM